MFSTVVELMTLVSLGLRPSLHAAARQMDNLPVSLASLYDKVNHTEAGILQALVQGSAQRLAPVMARMGVQPGLAGYELRVLDGNHLPGSEKRLAVLRGHRGAALPGQSIVVYDPDSGLVTDMIAGEDAHQSERTLAIPLLQGAKAGQVWIADRHFCTRTLLTGWDTAGACFIAREVGTEGVILYRREPTRTSLAGPAEVIGAAVAAPTPARSANKRLRLKALPGPGGASNSCSMHPSKTAT